MSAADRRFEPLEASRKFRGRLFEVVVQRFRFPDGEEAERELVHHGGAVGVVACDETHVWLVRQPREAVGEPDLLELPAGRLDHEGESPLETAKRELAEEIGKGAGAWEPLTSFYSSAGFTDERVHLFIATGLYDDSAESGENERIEVMAWPLEDLDGAIEACEDAKTLIGLLMLRRRRGG